MKSRVKSEAVLKLKSQEKYNVPVIGHFLNESIKYNSILEAEELTDISYHLIFDACIGRIKKAGMASWEYENGKYWIKYRAKHLRGVRILRPIGFNG